MSMMAERAAPKFLEWSEASQTWTKMRGRLIILGGRCRVQLGRLGTLRSSWSYVGVVAHTALGSSYVLPVCVGM